MADDRDIRPTAPPVAPVVLLEHVFEAPPLDNEQLDYLKSLQREARDVDEGLLIGGPRRRVASR